MAHLAVDWWRRARRNVVTVRPLKLATALVLLASMMIADRARAQNVNVADVWAQGRYRPFVAATLDFGFLYLRPRVAFGWGRPHSTWFGVEMNPIFSTLSVGGYGGLRAAFPFFDVRVGARGFRSFDHGYLPNQDGYSLTDFNIATGNATAIVYETEVRSVFRVGPGDIGLLASISHISGIPDGTSVFDDTLHVIARPPAIWRARAGYSFFIASQIGRFSITPVVDVLGNPSRNAVMLRAGMLATYLINKHLEVRASFVPVILSPDSIGIIGGDLTELGLRYRWATGD
jgi:hypothetical protein